LYKETENIRIKRPDWLKVKAPGGDKYAEIHQMMRSKSLHTVCEEAHCPNIGECWGNGTATFLILGEICTRNCRFCAITTGKPMPPDKNEPQNVAESVKNMKVRHAVITSVNRDDLADGGSTLWAETIRRTREMNPNTTIEVLIPDFMGFKDQLQRVIDERPDILNHNIETVPRLYKTVRPKAKYQQSLDVLLESANQGLRTKSGLMVGVGETLEEVQEVLKDLYAHKVKIVTIGQYLQPTKQHLDVVRFVEPSEFLEYKKFGLKLGFEHVESGPLVRSSYHAEKHV
jgi:lipoic acid synthetase